MLKRKERHEKQNVEYRSGNTKGNRGRGLWCDVEEEKTVREVKRREDKGESCKWVKTGYMGRQSIGIVYSHFAKIWQQNPRSGFAAPKSMKNRCVRKIQRRDRRCARRLMDGGRSMWSENSRALRRIEGINLALTSQNGRREVEHYKTFGLRKWTRNRCAGDRFHFSKVFKMEWLILKSKNLRVNSKVCWYEIRTYFERFT